MKDEFISPIMINKITQFIVFNYLLKSLDTSSLLTLGTRVIYRPMWFHDDIIFQVWNCDGFPGFHDPEPRGTCNVRSGIRKQILLKN